MGVSVLERELFSEAEAARLLRVPQSTLHWWLDGGTYRGRGYRPVIRLEPRGERSVTWAEFVEAGLLRQYRRIHGVSLSELRTVIDRLRAEYDTPGCSSAEPLAGVSGSSRIPPPQIDTMTLVQCPTMV